MKSDIGLLQEELPSGKITLSSTRVWSLLFIPIFISYMVASYIMFKYMFDKYVLLVEKEVITQESFNSMVLNLKLVDALIVMLFFLAIFAPKAIGKIAELWASSKINKQE